MATRREPRQSAPSGAAVKALGAVAFEPGRTGPFSRSQASWQALEAPAWLWNEQAAAVCYDSWTPPPTLAVRIGLAGQTWDRFKFRKLHDIGAPRWLFQADALTTREHNLLARWPRIYGSTHGLTSAAPDWLTCPAPWLASILEDSQPSNP